MTWIYTPDFTVDRDKVRFLSGDTNTSDQLVTDEEIAYTLTRSGNDVTIAAAIVCEALAAKYARKVTSAVGELRKQWSDASKAFADRAKDLRYQMAMSAVPVAGGVSIDRMNTIEDNSDIPDPAFKVGMLDNPSVSDDDDEDS